MEASTLIPTSAAALRAAEAAIAEADMDEAAAARSVPDFAARYSPLRYTAMWCEMCREAGVRWRVSFAAPEGLKLWRLGITGGFEAALLIGPDLYLAWFAPLGIIRNEAMFEVSRLDRVQPPDQPPAHAWLLSPMIWPVTPGSSVRRSS